MDSQLTVWVRGAGDLGSAAAQILHQVGFKVFLSDLPIPLAIRRPVTFSDAIISGETEVENVKAIRCDFDAVQQIFAHGNIPILVDNPRITSQLQPEILIDARMLKRSTENLLNKASFTIGLGPGFDAGQNCHAVIETMRGHNLGKIIRKGKALPNTKIPGNVGGETARRVIRAPVEGTLEWKVNFGDIINENDLIGTVNRTHEIRSPLSGLVRGLISPMVRLEKGIKIADIDPRGKSVDYRTVSDKSRAIGRGVLEALLIYLKQTYRQRY